MAVVNEAGYEQQIYLECDKIGVEASTSDLDFSVLAFFANIRFLFARAAARIASGCLSSAKVS